jgi:RNA-directed DNA polymerase
VGFHQPGEDQTRGKGPATYDFLGFTLHCRRTRYGRWQLGCKTRCARLRRAINAVYDLCRNQRHQPLAVQHAALVSRLQGHFNYFGVNGNLRCLKDLLYHAKRAWYKWLCRRSQRVRLTWERFAQLLRAYPLPSPRVVVTIWE